MSFLTDIADYRYDPFNETFSANPIGYSGNPVEEKIIPASAPYYIYTNELPRLDSPTSTLLINEKGGSSFTEVSKTTPPAAGQFRVIYGGDGITTSGIIGQGIIEFNSADAGKIMEIKYYGLGSILQKQFFDEIFKIANPIGSIIAIFPKIKTTFLPNDDYWALCDGNTALPVVNFDITAPLGVSGTLVDEANDEIDITSHGLFTGDKIHYTTDDTAIGGLTDDTDYWVIYVTDNSFALATSLTNAKAGTKIDLTSEGVGNHTFSRDYVPDLTDDRFFMGDTIYGMGGNNANNHTHAGGSHIHGLTAGRAAFAHLGNDIVYSLSVVTSWTPEFHTNIGAYTVGGTAKVIALELLGNTDNNSATTGTPSDIENRPLYFSVLYYIRIK